MRYIFFSVLVITIHIIPQITEAQKSGFVVYEQRINMRIYVEKNDTLWFSPTSSRFEWNLFPSAKKSSELAAAAFPSSKQTGSVESVITGQINYYDVLKDSLYSRMSLRHLNKEFFLSEETPSIDWTITDSTKSMGTYRVQQARASFRGHTYTVWFAPEIPVPYGPWKLHGLPGLILEAYNQTGDIYFGAKQVSLQAVEIPHIALHGREQHITLTEYKKIMANFSRLRKERMIRQARQYLSKEELANVNIEMSDAQHMELFKNDVVEE